MLKSGFARVEITPPLGTILVGYYRERYADGVITPLYSNAVAYSDGENTVVTVSLDILELLQRDMDTLRTLISERTGLPFEAIFVSCTHTHLGPEISGIFFATDEKYNDVLFRRICDSAVMAIADLKDSKAYIARGEAKGISFVRRFRMADGSAKTNPGANSDVVGPIGTPDETVQLIKLKRENAPDIAIINFQTHPDVIGGHTICADFPGFCVDAVEKALADENEGRGVKAVYFNGAQGDVNHVNRAPGSKSAKGVEHSRHMGRVIAGAVLSIYTHAEPLEDGKVFFGQAIADVALNKGTPEQVEIAREIDAKFRRNESIADYDMNIVVARRMIRLAEQPEIFGLKVVCVGFGETAFVGFPGEPFTEIGRAVKGASPFAMTIPCCNANGSEGYFPMMDAYMEDGYEQDSSVFKPGVAEKLIETANELVSSLKKQ